jgi:DNA-binding GntR family transcriptional regulator
VHKFSAASEGTTLGRGRGLPRHLGRPQLTAQTGLAVGTVRRAISVVANEGLVETVPARGTFVTR